MLYDEHFKKAIEAYEDAHNEEMSEDNSQPETIVIMSFRIAKSMVTEYNLFDYLDRIDRTDDGFRRWVFRSNETTRIISNKLIKDRRKEKQEQDNN